jgi:hypothetical protein
MPAGRTYFDLRQTMAVKPDRRRQPAVAEPITRSLF